MTVTDFPDWMGEGQQATSLLATGTVAGSPGGAPLLNYDQVIVQDTTLVVPSETILGPFNINQPSYVGGLTLVNGGVGGGELVAGFNWFDGFGNAVHEDIFNIFAGNGANPHQIMLEGPTRGTSVQVILSVSSSSTLNWFDLYQSSRIITKNQWRSTGWVGTNVAGTVPLNNTQSNVLAYCNANALAANSTTTFLLPMYIGKVMIYIQTSSGTSDMQCILRNAADQTAIGNQSLLLMDSNSSGFNFQNDVYLPYTQCSFSLHNGNAAPKNLFAVITGLDY